MMQAFLLEDHDQALKIWRRKNIRGLDLVHLDAHIDFGFYFARSVEDVIKEARSIKELKKKLEESISFLHYEKDFNRQTNIGNYIYPAMGEGIVQDFYWVVPGQREELNKSGKTIKNILKGIMRREGLREHVLEGADGVISAKCLGRNLIVCNLNNLPIMTREVLLDIDTDFLVIDSVLNAENTKNIGKRRPWILPQDLVNALKGKIENPKIITIAYSVNGGWTPMRYKHLADELAYYFQPARFKRRFDRNLRAAKYFELFEIAGRRECYQKAIKLNPTYRLADNNYGPLYLFMRKLSHAKKEFNRILQVDQKNPACLFGLGQIAQEKKEFGKARSYFSSAMYSSRHARLFSDTRKEVLLSWGKAEFFLKNLRQAKRSLFSYKDIAPLNPECRYLLGRVFEKEKKFSKAAAFYKDAVRLGLGSIEPLFKILRISRYLKDKNSMIQYTIAKYKDFKREFEKIEAKGRKKKKIKGLLGMKKKIAFLEEKLSAHQSRQGRDGAGFRLVPHQEKPPAPVGGASLNFFNLRGTNDIRHHS